MAGVHSLWGPPSVVPHFETRESTGPNVAWTFTHQSRRRLAWGSTMGIMAPSSGPLKRLVCRGKAGGSGGPCPLGAEMDSSA